MAGEEVNKRLMVNLVTKDGTKCPTLKRKERSGGVEKNVGFDREEK